MAEATKVFTLPQIAKLTGAQYRTLNLWVKRGILIPSIQRSNGSGIRDLFSERDVRVADALVELRSSGLGIKALEVVAEQLRHADATRCPVCGSLPIRLADAGAIR